MDRRLVVQDFLTDELVLIVPRNHPWAHKTRIPIRDLRHERFIVGATGSGVRCIVDECLRQKNVVLDKIIDLGNTEGIKKGVEAGFGVAILSRRAVQREIDAGTLHELCVAGLNTKRMLRYIYRRGRYLSRSETAFLKLLTDLRPSGRSSSSGKMASH
jgi:DNA-binding transcriptional LysR family regulator